MSRAAPRSRGPAEGLSLPRDVSSGFRVRRADPVADSAAVYRVCLETGDAGADGTHLYPDDPDALGRIYTQPYLELSREFCFVIEDGDGVAGYTLAALDSGAFYRRYEAEYIPAVRAAHPMPAGDEASWSNTQKVHAAYHGGTEHFPPSYADLFPSHLHIDLVARAQGKGNGRVVMEVQLAALAAAGSRGVHLGMSPRNLRAYGFYKKLGFIELGRKEDDLFMGLRFPANCVVSVPRTVAGASAGAAGADEDEDGDDTAADGAASGGAAPRFRCGVIEGFYGRPWSSEQRDELVTNMHAWGMDVFLYGPKDDKKHRAAWRELYNESELAAIRREAAACAAAGVTFVYALGPGLDTRYTDVTDHEKLAAKLLQVLHGAGVRSFALFFDDIADELSEADAEAFSAPAHAQCAMANAGFLAVRDAMMQLDGAPANATDATEGDVAALRFEAGTCRFLFCPTEYCSALARPSLAESSYLRVLGAQLLHEASILWTGPRVISDVIDVEHVKEVGAILQRRPLIWDNLHANDYDNGRRVYLGPFSHRPVEIGPFVEGILTNPNCEYEANFVPFRTLALYAEEVRTGGTYDPRAAYFRATEEWLPRFKITGVESAPVRPGGGASGGGAVSSGSGSGSGSGSRSGSGGEVLDNRMTIDDVRLLGDLFYLPYEHGDLAVKFLEATDSVLAGVAGRAPLADASTVSTFNDMAKAVVAAYTRLTELDNRELCYALYRFAWDAKEQAEVLVSYYQWATKHQQGGRGDATDAATAPGVGTRGPGYKSVYDFAFCCRGGIVADMQRRLVFGPDSTYRLAPPE